MATSAVPLNLFKVSTRLTNESILLMEDAGNGGGREASGMVRGWLSGATFWLVGALKLSSTSTKNSMEILRFIIFKKNPPKIFGGKCTIN
jgi:hypothetical protein